MKAVVIHKHGGPEVLKYQDVDTPKVGPTDVLVEIKAVGINHLDIWIRQGIKGIKLNFPHIPGSDMAGFVTEVGSAVSKIKMGDRVIIQPGLSCGHCLSCTSGWDNLCNEYSILGEHQSGGYAQFICITHRNVVKLPDTIGFVDAAALPINYVTAWQMLVTRAQVRPGEVVLIHGAGSGVSQAAQQITKLFGGKVIMTSSNAEKLKKSEKLGADWTIHTTKTDVLTEIKKITAGRGVDIVVEHVGQATWDTSIKACRRGGRLVTCGATSGYEALTDLRHIFYRQVQVLGSTMGSKSHLLEVLCFVAEGKLKPVIDRTLPLKEAAKAHTLLEERHQFGKIVLIPENEHATNQ